MIKKIINKILLRNSIIINYNEEKYKDTDGKRLKKALEFLKILKSEGKCGLSEIELLNLYCLVNSTNKLSGDVAEVGVHKGGSAKLLLNYIEYKTLYLFDTFEGLPKTTIKDNKVFEDDAFKDTSVEVVKLYLGINPNIIIHKGMFQDTCKEIKDIKFSFVHLDVDLYKSTLDCLKFFYPRMNKGAIIITHNYTDLLGVRKAVDSFLEDKNEYLIKFPIGTQAMFIKQ